MKHIKIIRKTALVACVSLCLMGLIATSCRTVDKSVQRVDLVQVSGTVLDDNNEPMIGASVYQYDNRKNAVSSNIDGQFTIYVPADAHLSIEYVGYIKAFLSAKDSMTIKLKRDPNYKEEHLIVM